MQTINVSQRLKRDPVEQGPPVAERQWSSLSVTGSDPHPAAALPSELRGALASGNHYRVTRNVVAIWSPQGELLDAIAPEEVCAVQSCDLRVTLKRVIGNDVDFSVLDAEDANALTMLFQPRAVSKASTSVAGAVTGKLKAALGTRRQKTAAAAGGYA